MAKFAPVVRRNGGKLEHQKAFTFPDGCCFSNGEIRHHLLNNAVQLLPVSQTNGIGLYDRGLYNMVLLAGPLIRPGVKISQQFNPVEFIHRECAFDVGLLGHADK